MRPFLGACQFYSIFIKTVSLFSPLDNNSSRRRIVDTISWNDFEKVEIRVGKIVEARVFEEARIPAYKLHIDFGPEIGMRKSSAQITKLYSVEELPGKLIVGVVNFPKKQIGPFMSECLVTGFHNENGDVALCVPDKEVPLGAKLC